MYLVDLSNPAGIQETIPDKSDNDIHDIMRAKEPAQSEYRNIVVLEFGVEFIDQMAKVSTETFTLEQAKERCFLSFAFPDEEVQADGVEPDQTEVASISEKLTEEVRVDWEDIFFVGNPICRIVLEGGHVPSFASMIVEDVFLAFIIDEESGLCFNFLFVVVVVEDLLLWCNRCRQQSLIKESMRRCRHHLLLQIRRYKIHSEGVRDSNVYSAEVYILMLILFRLNN